MARPKKNENERWISWGDYHQGGRTGRSGTKDTGHLTRNYSDTFEATILCHKENGEISGDLRVSFSLPIYTAPHGRALSDMIYELIERHKTELTAQATPGAVQKRLEQGWATKELIGRRVMPAMGTQAKRP
jgi:hypothetical protein